MTTMTITEEQFVPENDLEEKLLSAQRGSIEVDGFFLSLLQKDLFVPSATPVDDDLSGMTPLLYEREGRKLLAVFTALSRIGVLQSKAAYCLKMNGRELFLRLPPDHGIVVNPSCRVGWEMSPSAISGVLKRAE